MEQNTFSRIRLWCPRPLGTYSQNKQCCISVKKTTGDARTKENEPSCSENMPPPPSTTGGGTAPGDGQGEEGRVMLDTWYVIKPGNTKEKIAFFVAHQCGGGGSRSNAVKVKGNWSTDGTKPKRRRKSHDPTKGCPARLREPCRLAERLCVCSDPVEPPCETDPVSVAEMVARVEQRATAAPRGQARPPPEPCGATGGQAGEPPPPPMVVPEEQESGRGRDGGADTSRVAEAIAKFESAQRGSGGEDGGGRRNGLAKGEGAGAGGGGDRAPCSAGEVRIAFRVASGDTRSPAEAQSSTGPSCIFMSCNHTVCSGAMEKITCDLYHIVSPSSSSSSSSSSVSAADFPPGGGGGSSNNHGSLARSRSDVEMTTPHPVEEQRNDSLPDGAAATTPSSEKSVPRDCLNGFHVEVVVTGGVDQCVFFGREGAQGDKEDTVCVTVSGPSQDAKCLACEDPPPGQLFFLHSLAQSPEADPSADESSDRKPSPTRQGLPEAKEKAVLLSPETDPQDASLYCLYRHVSHDFLEIRFKIQRLLEPRQYLLLLPDHVTVKILSYLPTRALAALKCVCHHFKAVIEAYGVRATDSRWNRDPLYRDDPCKQCKKRYERGDVSLCRWHPKPYHHDLPYGRSYWMCCRRKDRDTPGCRIGLHDNNWVQPSDTLKREEGR
ncbi:F-box only protein 46 [Heterodontus francisci]|uniref:F-box only protein 46 n=1 Tax=Heterodontus francisci TaxID=7792 RepID=UPI00355C8F07